MKIILIALALFIPAYAQGPGVSIFEQSRNGIRAEEARIRKQAEKLFQDGKLLGLETIGELIKSPAAIKLELPVAQKNALTPTQVAERAKASGFRVGWAYLCNNCDNWHINLAGGYALTNDARHLIRFTTGGLPVIEDLGTLVDDPANDGQSIHLSCTSFGGDMIADDKGNLWN